MMERVLRKIVSAEALGLILVLIVLQAFVFGISGSLRSIDARQAAYFYWVGLCAVLLALTLSKRNLNGFYTSVALTVIGFLGIWILGARLALPLFNLSSEIISLLPQVFSSVQSYAPIAVWPPYPIDMTALTETWLVVAEASNALSARVQIWLLSLSENVTVNDALVRNMAWMLIVWLIAAWMGWFAGRRNAIASLLPSIVFLAVITSYSRYRIETLWLMVLILLLLMGIWNYKNHTTQWERRRVDYSDSIRYDVGQSVVVLAVAITLVAFVTPSVSWRDIRDAMRKWNQPSSNETADLLGIQQKPVIGESAPTQRASLPRDHLLSGEVALSEEVVMTIRTGEFAPMEDIHITVNVPRYYWRSIVYDNYVGAGWVTSFSTRQDYPPNSPLIPGLLNGYKPLHLEVEMSQPEGKLFWSGILFSADVPFTANWRVRPQSDLFADQATLLLADLFAATSNATTYHAEAYVPRAVISQMRIASTEYPDEIRTKYLQLPSTVPARVRQLAQDLTQSQPNAYDKAKAIEEYLRAYPYDLEVPVPPEGQDVADYFLFDLKKGYCDYYATAMVVLARASGIPARFVSGYSSGYYDAENARYVVREMNAHSWAEVYFPEIGWVEFEPTASQPEISRTLSENELPIDQPRDPFASELLLRFRLGRLTNLVLPVALILLVLILYYTWIERWRYLRLAPSAAIEKIYRKLYRFGRPLAGERTKAETAYEFMQKLTHKLNTISAHSRFAKLLRNAPQDIELLTELYQDTLFAHTNIQEQDIRKAVNTWKRLRLRLLMARLSNSLDHVILPAKRGHRFGTV
jgi:hypothetical protein